MKAFYQASELPARQAASCDPFVHVGYSRFWSDDLAMPHRAYSAAELRESMVLFETVKLSMATASSSDELALLLVQLLQAAEPLCRPLRSLVGRERLSLARLQHEVSQFDGDVVVKSIYDEYRFELHELPLVIAAINLPPVIRTHGHHIFDGEELTLLLLRRFRGSSSSLEGMTKETGRSAPAISEGILFVYEFLFERYPWLFDERSLTAWAPRFSEFADEYGNVDGYAAAPVDNMIGNIDCKQFETCRPGRGQRDAYSGHHRAHGPKLLGVQLANGIMVHPFVEPLGRWHDSTVLRSSGLLDTMDGICAVLGRTYAFATDAAFGQSRFLWVLHKGVMTPMQAAWNSDMAPGRVQVEWGFGKVVNLFPYVDYRKNLRYLEQPLSMVIGIAVVLTNIHTCIRGSIISYVNWVETPDAQTYMAGGPF